MLHDAPVERETQKVFL